MEDLKILLIVENTKIRLQVSRILIKAKCSLATANSGKVGLELSKNQTFDLIICNIDMKRIGRVGVLSVLNKFSETVGNQFVFLINEKDIEEVRSAMELTSDEYLLIPLNDAALLDIVHMHLRRKVSQQKIIKETRSVIKHLPNGRDNFPEIEEKIRQLPSTILGRKKIIYNDGDRPAGIYLLKEGKIKTYITDEQGRQLITRIFMQGEYLGVSAMILNSSYWETAEVIESASLISISAIVFNELMETSPGIANSFMKLLAGSLREQETKMFQLTYFSVRKRVILMILQLSTWIGPDNQIGHLDISCGDLAAITGTVAETLSRVLADLKSKGIIFKTENKIIVPERDKLII